MRRNIDMVARRRSGTAAGLRWTLAQRLPLPVNGFTVKRFIGDAETTVVDAIRLPGAAEIAPHSWTIDDAILVQDHTSRSASPGTPTLPALAELQALRPVLLFALPYADAGELEANLVAVACMLGDSHERDVNLRMEHWPDGPPPLRDDLAVLRNGSAASERAYSDVVAHYREQATTRLLFFSSNYPMAILLGLGFEDELPEDADHARYDLLCDWGGRNASSVADLKTKDADWPVPPTLEETIQGDGWAGYPGFARFYVAGSGWTPCAPAGDTLLEGLVAAASKGPRSCPAPTALLSWHPGPNGEPEGDEEKLVPLLGRGEVEWLIERHALGIAPSADEDPPKIDPAASFSPCHDANPLLRNKANSFEDDVDPPWEAPVLEGWHAYRITATDLFGISGPPSVPSLVCLRDRYAPHPPRPRLVHDGESLMLAPGANVVRLALDWDAANELSAPDATEFRVYQTWSSIEYIPLEVGESTEAAGELGSVQVDVRVLDADGRPVAVETLEKMPGGQLLTPDGEFAILGAGPGSVLRVRRSAGRPPPAGGAAARYGTTHLTSDEIARLARRRATTGPLRVIELSPLTVDVLDQAATRLPMEDATLYLQMLGSSFPVRADGAHFVVDQPPETRPRERELYDRITALDSVAAGALLDGSPAIVLPTHEVEVALLPPAGFAAGAVRLAVSAADGTAYVVTPGGIGNEGTRSELSVAARRPAAPSPVPRRVPRLWACDAAEFVELATASISWPQMAGAVRYEVERALEAALGLGPAAKDDVLLAAAEGASPASFERVTNAAFLPRCTDELPGRAPTRAVYRVRGVSAANTPGKWQVVALVRVPDVRIAPPCSLLTATPTPGADRAVTCCWTQAGPHEGVGFRIDSRTASSDKSGDDGLWEEVADLLPGTVVADRRKRFSVVLPNRRPGEWRDFRVTAVRHALDPADPRAKTTRRIDGRPSNFMRARATGELNAPRQLRADVSPTGMVTLRWINPESYAQLELRRRPPGGLGLVRREVGAGAETFCEPDRLPAHGEWTYQLAAVGHGRRALSEPLTLTWEAP